jgi:hypothetical protein
MAKPNDIPSGVHPVDSSTRDEIYGLPSATNRSLSDMISPDDWRLYHLMRELSNDDRHRILTFAEMLHSLREARRWAETTYGEATGDGR